MTSKPPTVLLTAAVDPKDTVFVMRRDVSLRLHDYQMALKRWLTTNDIQRLIFCENSGYPMDELIRTAREANKNGTDVIFLQRRPKPSEMGRGKGYGEMSIISTVVASGKLAPQERVIKVTGRYFLDNLIDIIADARIHPDASLISCPPRPDDLSISSDCFIATTAFLRDLLLPERESIDDSQGVFFEHSLRQAARLAVAHGLQHASFTSPPAIVGVSGTTNLPRNIKASASHVEVFLTPDYRSFFRTSLDRCADNSDPVARSDRARLYMKLGCDQCPEGATFLFTNQEMFILANCIKWCADFIDVADFAVAMSFPKESAELLLKTIFGRALGSF